MFCNSLIKISLGSPAWLDLGIRCEEMGRQVLQMAHVCNKLSTVIPLVEELHLEESSCGWKPEWEGDMKSTQWLTLFRPFSAVRGLYIDERLVPLVAPALQGLTCKRATEVLPALRLLVLVPHPYSPRLRLEDAEPFLKARRFSNHPLTIQIRDVLSTLHAIHPSCYLCMP